MTVLDISSLISKNGDTNHIYVGIASDRTVYAITTGRAYYVSEFTSYTGSYIYRYENGKWIYLSVSEFNNERDQENFEAGHVLGTADYPKQRPDGIRHILNPLPGVTIFAGQGGGNYIVFGTATISFESNGGSAVSPITQTVGSAVTPPASPTRDGFTFAGWYLSNMDIAMGNAPYKWTVMPAADITLYAKWTESSGGNEDPLEAEKEHAKESLQAVVDRLTQSDYDRATWAAIQEACSEGKAAIDAASTYDGIYDALNAAIDEINDLSKNTTGTATVAVTVEKLTVDGKYIIEPTLVECAKYERASVVVTDLLKEFWKDSYDGTPYTMTGTEVADFYLSGVWDGTTMLSEFDHGQQSGWLYCVNGSFPGVGASAYTLKNGDVMRWQYSCSGLGADIGNNNSSWGGSSGVTVADKDALIWKIAEINQAGEQRQYGEAYENAMTALQTIEAPQATVDAALAALNAVDTAEEQAAADQAAAKAVEDQIASIGRVTLNSENAINAARRAYNALTPQQKALVENLDVLEAAEDRLAELKAASGGNNGGNSGGNGSHHNNNNNNSNNSNNNGNEDNNNSQPTPSQTYADVPANAWYAEAVDYVTEKGLMQGVGANLFAPNAATSRAMIVTVLYRLAGSPAVSGDNPFSDVAEGAWYADAVAWANANGIVEGYGNGKFGSDDNITREQLAAILYRYAKAQGYDVSQTADLSGYGDAGQVDGWAQAAMAWACGSGLIQGDEQHNLLPGQGATRAQVAAILMRFVESAK
ncbi:MAG: S-layer homology domain-containing protein [Firmicutes bacterium]|nr:S-layer homology domain-containing protein [Bacillota bacterium]